MYLGMMRCTDLCSSQCWPQSPTCSCVPIKRGYKCLHVMLYDGVILFDLETSPELACNTSKRLVPDLDAGLLRHVHVLDTVSHISKISIQFEAFSHVDYPHEPARAGPELCMPCLINALPEQCAYRVVGRDEARIGPQAFSGCFFFETI